MFYIDKIYFLIYYMHLNDRCITHIYNKDGIMSVTFIIRKRRDAEGEKMITQRSIKNVKSMPTTKINAFLKEFPWVQGLLDGFWTAKRKPISQVYVSVVEPSLWEYHPEEYEISPDLLSDGVHHREMMFLLDEGHNVIMHEEKATTRKKFIFFGPRETKITIEPAVVVADRDLSFGSFITKKFEGEACTKVDAIRFILSYYRKTEAVIIYKIPKGVSLSGLMKEYEEAERKKFRKQIDL